MSGWSLNGITPLFRSSIRDESCSAQGCLLDPFRYPLLLNLASLFDNELAEKAWRARLEAHDGRSSSLFSEVCSELLARVHTLGTAVTLN